MAEPEQGATPANVVGTPEPAQAPEPVESGTTEQQAAEQEGQTPEKQAQELEQKARRARDRLQRRFGELTSKLDQKDRQIEQLLAVVQQAVPKVGGPQGAPAAGDGPPLRESFPDWESYQDARTEWRAGEVARREIEMRAHAEREESVRRGQMQSAQQMVQTFAQRQDAFAKSVPDYYEALDNSTAQLPDGIESVFVRVPESHVAAYAIAKNPELAQYLWGKDPVEQAAVLGSIVASYKSRPNPQVSTAPPPGKPVSTKGATSPKDPSTMTRDEYYDYITKARRK